MGIPLVKAQACYDRLQALLDPVCERVARAGSLRRGRPACGDIDIVAIPKTEPQRDLFGRVTFTANLAAEFLTVRALEKGWATLVNGEEILRFVAGGIQADVYWATAETWPSLLICKTGSKRHNIQIADRAKAMGLHWRPNWGLETSAGGSLRRIPTPTEEDFYRALQLPFIALGEREDIAHVLAAHPIQHEHQD